MVSRHDELRTGGGPDDDAPLVRYQRRGKVAVLTINRPERHNAWTFTDLLLSGRTIGAAEAERLSFVTRTAPRADLLAMAVEYAQDIAVHCAPLAVQAVKAQLDADATGDLASSVADARRIAHEPVRRPDVAEGARAFVEKRPPAFAPLPARARQGDDGRPGVEG